jgi:chorismate mutase/prephenate dehydratase
MANGERHDDGGELTRLRGDLDRVDREILEALARRHRLIEETARHKAAESDFLRDPAREEAMLARLREAARELGLDGFWVSALFRQIVDHSVRFQTDHFNGQHAAAGVRPLVVAYQGTDGAYSHLAAQHHFSGRGKEVEYRGHTTFPEAVEAVEQGDADYALLPIENTTAGSINEVYDVLAERDLWLVGEEVLEVEHCLVALSAVPLSHIRRIASHPQAIAQCGDFLRGLAHCAVESWADTAMAARRVRDERDLSLAAIASAEAARLYGLTILRRGIANQDANYTRFVAVARQPVRPDPRVPAKTSLAFVTVHENGALARCLDVLARHGLNLTKLESRPLYNSPWQYRFYLDFEGNAADPEVDRALAELEPLTRQMRVMGSYPVRRLETTPRER